MRLSIWNFLSVACLCGHFPSAWSGPEQGVDGDNLTLTASGEVKLDYFDQRTKDRSGKVKNDSDSLIDEAELALNARFGAFPDLTLVLATEKIGAPDFEPAFVKEFIVIHGFDANHRLIAGRMVLPFGFFKTATVTDPQTKKIGKSKTDAGLGVKGKNDTARLEWDVIAFANDYRTPGPGADGVTANLSWKATNALTVGAGAISHQYARADAPALADVFVGVHDGGWKLSGEYVAAVNTEGGERPRAWSVDGAYRVAPSLALGVRRQMAERRSVVDGTRSRYDEWAVALKHTLFPRTTIEIEYLTGRRRGEPVDFQDVRKITARVILSF